VGGERRGHEVPDTQNTEEVEVKTVKIDAGVLLWVRVMTKDKE